MFSTGIYIITSPTNKIYVGQSRNLVKRKSSYKNLGCKAQPKLYNSLKKYGWDAHIFEVIMPLKKGTSLQQLRFWEDFFIKFYTETGYTLLNIREWGGLDTATINKIKRSRIGMKTGPMSNETRKKLSIARMGIAPWNKGVPMSEAQKQLLSKVTVGRRFSEEKKRKHANDIAGERNGFAKLNNIKVRIILHAIQFGETDESLGTVFSVSKNTINKIRNGRMWSHVTGIYHRSRKHKLEIQP